MSKFKVGDKVRLLAKDKYDVEYLTVGEIGVVRSVTGFNAFPIRVDFPSASSNFNFKEENIELVEAESATPATSEATYESLASLVNAYLESARADRHDAFRALNEAMKPYYESVTRRARQTALAKLTDDDCEALGIIR